MASLSRRKVLTVWEVLHPPPIVRRASGPLGAHDRVQPLQLLLQPARILVLHIWGRSTVVKGSEVFRSSSSIFGGKCKVLNESVLSCKFSQFTKAPLDTIMQVLEKDRRSYLENECMVCRFVGKRYFTMQKRYIIVVSANLPVSW